MFAWSYYFFILKPLCFFILKPGYQSQINFNNVPTYWYDYVFIEITAFFAASSKLLAVRMGNPDSDKIFLASVTLVPTEIYK